MNDHKKLSLKKILTFGSGDMFGGGSQVLISFFYLVFLTDVILLEPALAGTVVLLARVWDAISDPLMGIITDRTTSKMGRRRPYFIIGFFLIIISYVLLFYPAGFDTQTGKFLFALFGYLFYSTVFTMVFIPYVSMSAEISPDYEERNTVNGVRLAFSQFASLIAAVVPLTIVKMFSSVPQGWSMMGLVFGIFFALPYILIFFFIEDKQMPKVDVKKFDIKVFLSPFKVKTFRMLIGLYIGAYITMDIVSVVFAYFMRYYLGRPEDIEIILGILLISLIIMLPVVVIGANKIGKGKTFIIGALIAMVGVSLMALLPQDSNVVIIYAVASVVGIGLAPTTALPWLMFPDAVDAGVLKFKDQNAGSYGGVMTFVRKMSSAIAIFLVAQFLGVFGYISPVADEITGALTYFDQPQEIITVLRVIVAVIPVVLLVLAMYFAYRYPMNRERHNKLKMHLDATSQGAESPLLPEEITELEEILL